jgi:cell division protein FtsX
MSPSGGKAKFKVHFPNLLNSNTMKFRTIILIAFVALVTVSFTFATVNNVTTSKAEQTSSTSSEGHDAPVGGFVSEKVIK